MAHPCKRRELSPPQVVASITFEVNAGYGMAAILSGGWLQVAEQEIIEHFHGGDKFTRARDFLERFTEQTSCFVASIRAGLLAVLYRFP